MAGLAAQLADKGLNAIHLPSAFCPYNAPVVASETALQNEAVLQSYLSPTTMSVQRRC